MLDLNSLMSLMPHGTPSTRFSSVFKFQSLSISSWCQWSRCWHRCCEWLSLICLLCPLFLFTILFSGLLLLSAFHSQCIITKDLADVYLFVYLVTVSFYTSLKHRIGVVNRAPWCSFGTSSWTRPLFTSDPLTLVAFVLLCWCDILTLAKLYLQSNESIIGCHARWQRTTSPKRSAKFVSLIRIVRSMKWRYVKGVDCERLSDYCLVVTAVCLVWWKSRWSALGQLV